MPYTILQAERPTQMVDILNGVILARHPIQSERVDGGPMVPATEEVINGLNGLTLVFTTPAVTVTFATPDPVPVSDMIGEIDTQVKVGDALFEGFIIGSTLAPRSLNPPGKRIKMLTGTAAGLVLNLATSTAAAKLGFPTTGTLSGIPIDPLKIAGGGDTISGGLYIIVAP
jgi:hypothetical protein